MEGSRALFGRGLGRVLGEVWRLWRPSWAVLESLFSMLAFGVVFKVLLEASGLDAGSIFKGLGRISPSHPACWPGVGGFCLMLAHFSLLWLIFSIF